MKTTYRNIKGKGILTFKKLNELFEYFKKNYNTPDIIILNDNIDKEFKKQLNEKEK